MFPSNGINALNGVKISKNRIVWKRERERGREEQGERVQTDLGEHNMADI